MIKLKEDKLQHKKNIIGLMGTYLMNNILYMFLNTFMVAYFITLTNYNYKLISIYYIMSFIFIIITFLLLAHIIKNKNQIYIYRIGIILHCIYVLTLALLREQIVNYYMFLGPFYGIVQGFFWSAGHVLINEHVGKDSENFISLKSMIYDVLKILVPIIFGVSIELTSFSYVARIILIISVIQFIFSLLITDKKVICKKKYSLKAFWLKFKNNYSLKKYYMMICCDGIVSYLLDTLITLIIVMTFKTTISLGFLTTFFSIFSIISVFIYKNKIRNKQRVLGIAAIGMVFSVLLLLFSINKITVIIYNLCAGVFLILLCNNAQSKRYSIISNIEEIEKDYLVEHQVLSELYLNITRIIGYGVLLVASLFSNMIIFKILLILVTIVIVMYSKLMIDLEKKNN